MSGKSRNSVPKTPDQALDRPFDPTILKEARTLALQYRLLLERDEDGTYIGSALELPLVFGDGRTPDQCVRDTFEALTAAVAYLLEQGRKPPLPSSQRRRQEQVNIRLTAEEKLLLEEAARAKGFRGISDFVRSTTLASIR